MDQKRVIFYELNEVPYRIFDHFASLMPTSSLAEVRRRSRAYETYAEDSGTLNPWVTWPSLHRGVTNDEHGISDFGMDLEHLDKDFPPIWKILTQFGVKCGIFGTLHTHPLPDDLSNYSFYVPDTFAAGPECFPATYDPFQKFNLRMTSKSKRDVTSGIAFKEAARFLAAAPGLGLRGRTVAKLAQQVIAERFDRKRTVRRRTSQAQIAFDFFMRAVAREKPDMSFFYTNHVASSMHRYWASLFPDDFTINPYSREWQQTWSNEIPFVINETNYQISQMLNFVRKNSGYVLAVATSMGQAAEEGREQVKSTLIIDDLGAFLSALSLGEEDWGLRPAMAPQYNFHVTDAAKPVLFQNLGGLSINGMHIDLQDLGSNVMRMNFLFNNLEDIEMVYKGTKVDPKSFGIKKIRLTDQAGRNGKHVPEGMLLIYDPEQPVEAGENIPEKISALDVAPAFLANFGVQAPSYMSRSFRL